MEQQPQLVNNFLRILAEFTEGDPLREGVLWAHLSRREISRRRVGKAGQPAHDEQARAGPAQGAQEKSMGAHPERDAQFRSIAQLKAAYQKEGVSVIIMDSLSGGRCGPACRRHSRHESLRLRPIRKTCVAYWHVIFRFGNLAAGSLPHFL